MASRNMDAKQHDFFMIEGYRNQRRSVVECMSCAKVPVSCPRQKFDVATRVLLAVYWPRETTEG
jgi:hypothetical protein